MCGIAGIVAIQLPSDSSVRVGRMSDLIAHRGPDAAGVWSDSHACLGHRRLSIIDLSPAGRQPMADDRGNVLVFNGEIYNHAALRTELEGAGVVFHSRTDSEVLLHGYRVWGRDVITKIRGMFSFALWDGPRRILFCGRDPFGKKPFYYHCEGGRIVFASEIEATVAGLDRRPRLDSVGLSHYLFKDYFAPGQTVYESVRTLKPSSFLEFSAVSGELRCGPYREMRFALGTSGETSACSCESLLGVGVERRLQSDVPLGVLLSGGVDSSLVAYMAAERSSARLQTFTAAFRGTSFDESRYAEKIAKLIGSDHREIGIRGSALPDMLARLVPAYGEPFGDDSAIAAFSLFEGLKPHVKVALTGDGGDEVFAGYKDVVLFLLRTAFRPLTGAAQPLPLGSLEALARDRSSRLRKIGYLLLSMRVDGADVFKQLSRGAWGDYWRERTMRPEAYEATGRGWIEEHVAAQFRSSGDTDLERYLNLCLERLSQSYLVKIDRASMAHSIEARCPLLDADLFDWASRLPSNVLLPRFRRKAILKDLLKARVPGGFADRAKMGFTAPLSDWLRMPKNQAWVLEGLTDPESLAYSLFQPERLRDMVQQHLQGFDHTGRLWKLMWLNEWHSRYVLGKTAAA